VSPRDPTYTNCNSLGSYGGTNLSATEASTVLRAQQLQRLSFALLSGEEDQYIYHLPFLMERLNDCFKSSRSSTAPPRCLIMAFVLCRCIILRFSESNLGKTARCVAHTLTHDFYSVSLANVAA
jgi:hypothetical protein